MTHSHDAPERASQRRLLLAVALNFGIAAVEAVGGLLSGALSLVSDALHNAGDSGSLFLTLVARRLAGRRNSARHTFGFRRAETLAAVVNAAALIGLSVALFMAAVARLMHPVAVHGGLMIGVGLFGVVANVAGTLLLHRDARTSLNVRSSYLHLVADVGASVAVVGGGIALVWWQADWVDPVLSIAIAGYAVAGSVRVLRQAVHVLMEGTPPDLDLLALQRAVHAVHGVVNIHHVHVWSVGESDVHLDAHLEITDMLVSETQGLRAAVEAVLASSFGIDHATLQLEAGCCADTDLVKVRSLGPDIAAS